MVDDSNSPPSGQSKGRWIGWVAVVLGALLLLGTLSALANGTTTETTNSAETAGAVFGRIVIIVVGILAIVYGVRKLRR